MLSAKDIPAIEVAPIVRSQEPTLTDMSQPKDGAEMELEKNTYLGHFEVLFDC